MKIQLCNGGTRGEKGICRNASFPTFPPPRPFSPSVNMESKTHLDFHEARSKCKPNLGMMLLLFGPRHSCNIPFLLLQSFQCLFYCKLKEKSKTLKQSLVKPGSSTMDVTFYV